MGADHEHDRRLTFYSEGAQCHMPLMPVKFCVIEDRDDFIIKSEFCLGFRGSRLHFHGVLLLTADCVTLASLYQAACEASVFSLRMPFSNV